MNKSIVIIVAYFGKLPSHMNLWVKSCEYNSDINWIIVTDQVIHQSIPSNIRYIKMTLKELSNRISNKLNLNICLKYPYKLCDFKPAYGIIFDDLIKDYEFWGHCDLDMIFGNIRIFITGDILDKYNKVLSRGHLVLYRNSIEVNNYFRLQMPDLDYKKIFLDNNNNYLFDEWDGIHKIFNYYNISQYNDEFIADINPKRKKLMASNIKNYDKQVFYWENGHLFQQALINNKMFKRELAYIHFQKRKFKKFIYNSKNIRSFYITPDGFLEKKGPLFKKDYKLFNKDNFFYYFIWKYKRINKKIFYNLKKIKVVYK